MSAGEHAKHSALLARAMQGHDQTDSTTRDPRHTNDAGADAPGTPPEAVKLVVPLMLFTSSVIMAIAWLGHLKFKELPLYWAIPAAWLIVLPEYILNVGAIRLGYGTFTGGNMATFNLCTGVLCVALVSWLVLGEALTAQQIVGFALMAVAMVLVAAKPTAKEAT